MISASLLKAGSIVSNLAMASEITNGTQNGTSWGITSFAARVNYTFRDKYILTVSARRDGSSRFGENKRYGLFPAISAAWRIIDEPFMVNNTLFSDLKLRASYGSTGNQEGINNFASRVESIAGISSDKIICRRLLAHPTLKINTAINKIADRK